MAQIVLATLNAKYIHASFGLRCLFANLGELQPEAVLAEFEIQQTPVEIVETLLARNPRIIGIGVYIWNVTPATEVVALLKRLRPDIQVILGGPEVSFETEQQEIVRLADFVVTGEADLQFPELCRQILSGRPPSLKVIPAPIPDLASLASPYPFYTEDDIAHRVVYVEASRGCPFTCEFCLSSLDVPVRQVPLEGFLRDMKVLMDRGVTRFKFVDRTFNLNLPASRAILQFFLEHLRPGLFIHFEMVPDRLPDGLRELILKFPPGALQFEVGIQSFNEEVSRNISRRQDYNRLADNFRFLREQTGVHVHADLIAGLPGETLESFAAGFDRLVALGPQEIQVGILKRLRGTPIIRHDKPWEMIYSPAPPFEILQNKNLDFVNIQKLRRFARYWDLVANSGNFTNTTPLLWRGNTSPFRAFMAFSEWLFHRAGRRHGIALNTLAEFLFDYVVTERGIEREAAARRLWSDYRRCGRHETPAFLREFVTPEESRATRASARPPRRQSRHLGVSSRQEANHRRD
jgi:radical SAM superfamily enzyme YgiQ (UPF0313 family)